MDLFPNTCKILCRTISENCEGCVIHTIEKNRVETVVLLNNKFAEAKDFVQIDVDVKDYYKIKDSKDA